jgi:hypothetical protein
MDSHNKLVFVLVKPFNPCLMFVGKAGAYYKIIGQNVL